MQYNYQRFIKYNKIRELDIADPAQPNSDDLSNERPKTASGSPERKAPAISPSLDQEIEWGKDYGINIF